MPETQIWKLIVSKSALKSFKRLDKPSKNRVFRALEQLLVAENPLAVGPVTKIKRKEDLWRIQIANLRIVFHVDNTVNLKGYRGQVVVHDISHKNNNNLYKD